MASAVQHRHRSERRPQHGRELARLPVRRSGGRVRAAARSFREVLRLDLLRLASAVTFKNRPSAGALVLQDCSTGCWTVQHNRTVICHPVNYYEMLPHSSASFQLLCP